MINKIKQLRMTSKTFVNAILLIGAFLFYYPLIIGWTFKFIFEVAFPICIEPEKKEILSPNQKVKLELVTSSCALSRNRTSISATRLSSQKESVGIIGMEGNISDFKVRFVSDNKIVIEDFSLKELKAMKENGVVDITLLPDELKLLKSNSTSTIEDTLN